MQSEAFPSRKTPFPTVIPFTKTALQGAMQLVRDHGLKQVQFCSANEPGFHAMVYPHSAEFYVRYCLHRRPARLALGEFGLITLDQARQKYREARLLASQGIDPRKGCLTKMTFAQLHAEHLIRCESAGNKSIATDIGRYETWLRPRFADLPVAAISVSDINRLMLEMKAAGKAASTIRNVVSLLSGHLSLAVDLEVIASNPARKVKLPRAHNVRDRYPNVTEMAAFIAAAQRRPEVTGSRCLILLALTGARLGEACNAKWIDMDLEKGVWSLPTQKSGKPGVIYLSEAAIATLREMLPLRKGEYVFPGERGNPRISRPIKLFRRICRDAGLDPSLTIHSLRHGHISAAVHAGVPLEIVSQCARHSSPVMTRRYAHAQGDALMAAQRTVANLLAPSGG